MTISRHIANFYSEGELQRDATVPKTDYPTFIGQ